jgi:hypothetical protein
LGLRFNDNAIRCAPSRWQREILLAARKKRQGQNRLPGFIRYDHHQSEIIVAALLSQLSDCVLGIRKCCRSIWQVRAISIVLDPVSSVYREEISRHRELQPIANFLSCGAAEP